MLVSELEEAVSNYVVRACEKLRAQGSRAQGLYVFLRTSPFVDPEKRYSNGMSTFFQYQQAIHQRLSKKRNI